jgi:hypothetical protein
VLTFWLVWERSGWVRGGIYRCAAVGEKNYGILERIYRAEIGTVLFNVV